MSDDGRLPLQSTNDSLEVVGDLTIGLLREQLRIRICFGDGLGMVRPARRKRRESCVLEHRRPSIATARQQPESVDEHDGLESGLVRAVELLCFVIGNCWCAYGGGLGPCGGHAFPPQGGVGVRLCGWELQWVGRGTPSGGGGGGGKGGGVLGRLPIARWSPAR